MKGNFLKIFLLLVYCVPFVFLAMNEDAVFGTCWFYLVMIVVFGVLAYLCVKTKNVLMLYVGNGLSFVSSCFFAWNFQTPKWEYYFKPFLPNQLIIFETIVAIVLQSIIVICIVGKNREWKIK